MVDVFISYSRKDKDFVQVLHQALVESKYDAWIDWQDIPLTADWWAEIEAGIEAADAFVFVISPDSVLSRVCNREIDHAVDNHKRLVPIVRRQGFTRDQLHVALSKHNWLYFRAEDEFQTAFAALVNALDLDLDHVREHTRLLVKAVEWDKKDRHGDLLLRGRELEAVFQWLANNAEKEPRSTQLQRDYINASRVAEATQQKVALEHQTKVRRQITAALVAALGVLVVAAGLGLTAWQQYRRAETQRQEATLGEIEAQVISANALLDNQQPLDALLTTLTAASNLQRVEQADVLLTTKLKAVLHQAIFTVQEQNRLVGHGSYWATAVSFNPQGDRIASGGMDGTLKLWTRNGELLQTFADHAAGVYDLSFSPNGQTLASASYDGTVKLWAINGQLLHTWDDHEQRVTSVRFSPDGTMLATASDDRTIHLIDLDSKQFQRLQGHTRGIHSLDWSPDGNQLVSIDYLGHIKLWSKTGTAIATSPAPANADDFVPRVSFSPDGKSILATGSANSTVSVWPLDLQQPQATVQGSGYLASSFAYSPDGEILAIASEGNRLTGGSSIALFDRDGHALGELWGHVARINDLSFSPNGQTLVSAGFDGTVRVWNLAPPTPKRLVGHRDEVKTVVFSPDGQLLASTGADSTTRVWQLNGQELHQFANPDSGAVSEASFSPNSQWLALGYDNGSVALHNLTTGTTQHWPIHKGAIRSVDFSHDRDMFVSSSDDGTVNVMNLEGKVLKTYAPPAPAIARFNPQGTAIALATKTDLASEISLWHWEDDDVQQRLGGFGGIGQEITDMAFSADGAVLGITNWEGVIHLWDLQQQKQSSFFAGFDGPVRTLGLIPSNEAFSAPHSQLLAASSGGYVRFWTLDGEEIQRFYTAPGRVLDIAVSPDGNTIAAAHSDSTITLFNLNLDELIEQGCTMLTDHFQSNLATTKDVTICD